MAWPAFFWQEARYILHSLLVNKMQVDAGCISGRWASHLLIGKQDTESQTAPSGCECEGVHDRA